MKATARVVEGLRHSADMPPQETPAGSEPRPTPKELEQRAEALGKEIREHLDRGTRR
ncbi:hypothetical protein AB4212_25955 [Streptomyces sp. 2MCAF27]